MKRGKLVVSVYVLAAVFALTAPVFGHDYDHSIELKKMSFAWKVDGERLGVKLTGKSTGWVGIGFNPSKKMKDANYVLGYVKDGKAKIRDDFGVGEKKHKADEKLGGTSDALIIGGNEENGITTIEFSIPLVSEDKHDTTIDPMADTIVLLAYGGKRDSFRSTHKFRTILKVNLSTGHFEKVGK